MSLDALMNTSATVLKSVLTMNAMGEQVDTRVSIGMVRCCRQAAGGLVQRRYPGRSDSSGVNLFVAGTPDVESNDWLLFPDGKYYRALDPADPVGYGTHLEGKLERVEDSEVAGTNYLVRNEALTGAINGANKSYTLGFTPVSVAEIALYVIGPTTSRRIKSNDATNGFTLSGLIVTLGTAVTAPTSPEATVVADYTKTL